MKEKDKDGKEILACFDKAIELTEHDKDRFVVERREAFLQITSAGGINEHKELANYYD